MQEIHTDLEGTVTQMDDEVGTHVESPVEEDPLEKDAELLSFAARVALLREKDPAKKAGLARRAIDGRLSVRELRVLVRGGIAAMGKSPADRLLELATKIERMIRPRFPVDYENVDLVMVAVNYLERSAATLREAARDALPEQ